MLCVDHCTAGDDWNVGHAVVVDALDVNKAMWNGVHDSNILPSNPSIGTTVDQSSISVVRCVGSDCVERLSHADLAESGAVELNFLRLLLLAVVLLGGLDHG